LPWRSLRAERTGIELAPGTQYARKGEINIAYQVVGDGPVDLDRKSSSPTGELTS
jgi:hypothetical protein